MGSMETLTGFLFVEGREVKNVKFFPGDSSEMTRDQFVVAVTNFLGELLKAPANRPPSTGMKPKLLNEVFG